MKRERRREMGKSEKCRRARKGRKEGEEIEGQKGIGDLRL